MNDSFMDGHGVEIGACAIFEHFAGSDKFFRHDKMTESHLQKLSSVFCERNFKESFLYQTGVADYEKRTPEVKFRLFFSHILFFPESIKS